METQAGIKDTARKLLFPAAVSVVGGSLGWLLSRNPKQLAQGIPRPHGGIGDLKDDLLGRLDSVLGRDGAEEPEEQGADSSEQDEQPDASEFEERRAERQKRREERKQRLKA